MEKINKPRLDPNGLFAPDYDTGADDDMHAGRDWPRAPSLAGAKTGGELWRGRDSPPAQ